MTADCRNLAARVLDKIRTEPQAHDQTIYAALKLSDVKELGVTLEDGRRVANCGTTACVCGWASMLAGDMAITGASTLTTRVLPGSPEHTYVHSVSRVYTPQGVVMQMATRGAELLCLEPMERIWLFDAYRNRAEVLHALEELVAGKRLSFKTEFTSDEIELLENPPQHKKTRVVRVKVKNSDASKQVKREVEA